MNQYPISGLKSDFFCERSQKLYITLESRLISRTVHQKHKKSKFCAKTKVTASIRKLILREQILLLGVCVGPNEFPPTEPKRGASKSFQGRFRRISPAKGVLEVSAAYQEVSKV